MRNPDSQYSLEFFPPRTQEGIAKLRAARREFALLQPAFCSVTFGAGGSTREGTLDTVLEILAEGVPAAPHLSCIGASRESLREVLAKYRGHGIRHLVAFIRETTGDWFHVDVACYPEYHPQARSPAEDMDNFERKVRAGADAAITQYFFNRDAYWNFVDLCAARGITIPIVPGVMPIASASRLARFSDAGGAEIPRWIRRRLEGFGDDTASVRAFGLDVVTDLCARLLEEGAPGLHFYTLNSAGLTTTIWQRLALS